MIISSILSIHSIQYKNNNIKIIICIVEKILSDSAVFSNSSESERILPTTVGNFAV